jgi:Raf kinase inhibitor-like YbhB/YbcL family protein
VESRSSAFAPGSPIPSRHACKGEDFSPSLNWRAVPEDEVALALILNHPDTPPGTFTHRRAWDIAPETGRLAGGERPPCVGRNDHGAVGYRGPCPPGGHGTHRYFFHRYARGRQPARCSRADRRDLVRDMDGGVLEVAERVGTFRR